MGIEPVMEHSISIFNGTFFLQEHERSLAYLYVSAQQPIS